MKLLGVVAFLLHALSCLAFSPRAGGCPSKGVPGSSHRVVRATTINRPLPRTHLLRASSSPFDFLQSIFTSSSKSSATEEPPRPRIPDVVVDSDYTLAAAFAVVGVSIIAADRGGVGGALGGGFFTLLASLFAVQASRIRFVFDETCFELKTVDSIGSDDLRDSGENIVVGGANRWAYASFVNWDFFPSPAFPVLVYFKETQTPRPDGSGNGQIHFFPAIANCKQLKEQVSARLVYLYFSRLRCWRQMNSIIRHPYLESARVWLVRTAWVR